MEQGSRYMMEQGSRARPLGVRSKTSFRVGLLFASVCSMTFAGTVTELDGTTVTVDDLVNSLAGKGVSVSDPVLVLGENEQIGLFKSFDYLFDSDFADGVVISNGLVADVVSTVNLKSNWSYNFGQEVIGDTDLSYVNNGATDDADAIAYDAVKLQFQVVPEYDTLILDFIFGSDEYLEYVDGGYNDNLIIKVNGEDCALTPDNQIISIDSVNNQDNDYLFNDNAFSFADDSPYPTEMDGFTDRISCRVSVEPYTEQTVVVALVDIGDYDLDSWAFFRAESLYSTNSSDFGDAPDSYQTLSFSEGASHVVQEGLFLGSYVEGDVDGFVDGTDDSDGEASDDSYDDGVLSFEHLTNDDTGYELTVNATAINGLDAQIMGWVDFNIDGLFQENEASELAVLEDGNYGVDVTLSWPDIADITYGMTYARIRIVNSDETLDASSFAGSFNSGEVEDYYFEISGVGDSTLPQVSIDTADNVLVSNQNYYVVSGSCIAGDGDVTVTVEGAEPESQSVICSGSGYWSATFDVSGIMDGTDTVIVNASQVDANGNTGTATTVYADKAVNIPSVEISGVPAYSTAPFTAIFEFSEVVTGFDESDISVSNALLSDFTLVDGSTTTYSALISPVSAGEVTVDVAADVAEDSDTNGNVAAAQAVSVFDAENPDIAITSDGSGGDSGYSAGELEDVVISGTTTAEDDQLVTVTITQTVGEGDEAVITEVITYAFVEDGLWQANAVDLSAFIDGDISISADVNDAAGNAAETAIETTEKYTQIPSVSADAITATSDTTPAFSGTSDQTEGAVVDIFDDSASLICSTEVLADSSWSCTPESAIDQGSYSFTALVTDEYGNTSTDDFSVEIDLDSDNDGIADVIEGTDDSDGDGVADYLDTDSDNDGISDGDETDLLADLTGKDSDADGIDDAIDVDETDGEDANGNGIDDAYEGSDSDGDGIIDSLDTDSDNDGTPDSEEGVVDSDEDGVADYLDLDSDNDGIPDAVEGSTAIDSDGDGTPDYLDIDSDNDGITDAVEAQADASVDENSDGIVDGFIDADADGLDDNLAAELIAVDTDNDDVPDYLDTDSDGDGIPDVLESTEDSDGDSVSDYLDTDSDGDAISDADESGVDLDLTGTDSDTDGIDDAIDVDETNGADSNLNGIDDAFEPVDSDVDGIADYLDLDSDNDGIADLIEGVNLVDTDEDGTADYLDLDSDGDGLTDAIEAHADASVDNDLDGLLDSFIDINNDGLDDDAADYTSALDSDADGTPDYQDSDSDNDGNSDAAEAPGGVAIDTDGDGIPDYLDLVDQDSDNDGIPDILESTADSDGDGVADYLDTDSDNDGISDTEESDTSVALTGTDSDLDGIDDAVDVDETDGEDSNSNGIDDAYEGIDSDNDGIIDSLDSDADNDGTPDVLEGSGDTDLDGTADYLDLDSDNDGIPDAVENTDTPALAGTDSDADGIDDAIDVDETQGDDDNANGIDDVYEATDSDADGIADYLELDSDNDSVPDIVESSYLPTLSGNDSDNDGLDDAIDVDQTGGLDENSDGIDDMFERNDSDGDGLADMVDIDSDNDGIADIVEAGSSGEDINGNGIDDTYDADITGGSDSEGDGIDDVVTPLDSDDDGIPDMLDPDSENDGLTDAYESGLLDENGDGFVDDGSVTTEPQDTDGDGTPDYLDLDSNNDGILDIEDSNGSSLDTDGDGQIDSDGSSTTADSDSDGILDSEEGTDDADNDGIANYLDEDSDGDGISDAEEGTTDTDGDGIPNYLDLDSDNDGFSDEIENGDFDNDGIQDYLQDTGDLETAVRGVGSFGLEFLLLTPLLLLGRIGRRQSRAGSLSAMGFVVVSAGMLLPKAAFAHDAIASRYVVPSDEFGSEIYDPDRHAGYDESELAFIPGWYIGVGLGGSHVEPEGNAGGFYTDDDSDWGYKVFVGKRFLPHWSAELSYADLGEAGLANDNSAIAALVADAAISYKVPSISGMYHFMNPNSDFDVFGKVGLSVILNDASDDLIPYESQTTAQLNFGAGASWRFAENWMARIDIDSFDDDAAYYGVSLAYIFNHHKEHPLEEVAEPKVMPEPIVAEVVPEPEPEPVIAEVEPEPVFPITNKSVEEVCVAFSGTIEGIQFNTGSFDFTEQTQLLMDGVVQTLIEYSMVDIEVQAHTDSIGSKESNQLLSDQRADAVKYYLVANGIAPERISTVGFGETQPRASNDTPEGRAQNRRVEFTVTSQDICQPQGSQSEGEEVTAP